MFNVEIDIKFNDLPKLIPAIRREAQQVIAETVDEGVTIAQEFAPVDTGELRDEIHGEGEGDLAGSVVSSTDHSLFQEFGTRYQSGTPFMKPMSYAMKPKFIERMNGVVERAAGG